jgi:hypothetical protein
VHTRVTCDAVTAPTQDNASLRPQFADVLPRLRAIKLETALAYDVVAGTLLCVYVLLV